MGLVRRREGESAIIKLSVEDMEQVWMGEACS